MDVKFFFRISMGRDLIIRLTARLSEFNSSKLLTNTMTLYLILSSIYLWMFVLLLLYCFIVLAFPTDKLVVLFFWTLCSSLTKDLDPCSFYFDFKASVDRSELATSKNLLSIIVYWFMLHGPYTNSANVSRQRNMFS